MSKSTKTEKPALTIGSRRFELSRTKKGEPRVKLQVPTWQSLAKLGAEVTKSFADGQIDASDVAAIASQVAKVFDELVLTKAEQRAAAEPAQETDSK